jgi:hypothetical protein
MTFETDWYTDQRGRRWHCVAMHSEGRMVCNTDDGTSYTVANFETFARWAWRRCPQASEAPHE